MAPAHSLRPLLPIFAALTFISSLCPRPARAEDPAPLDRGDAGVLDGAGSSSSPLATPDPAPRDPNAPNKSAAPGARPQLGLSFGGGGLNAGGGQPATQTANFSFNGGVPLTEHLRTLFDAEFATLGRSTDLNKTQAQSVVTFGLQWAPFKKRLVSSALTLDKTNFVFRAGLGVGMLDLDDARSWGESSLQFGGAVTYGLAWMPLRRTGFELGFEVSGITSFYKSQVREQYGVNLAVHFDL